jgi:hypothetical protein
MKGTMLTWSVLLFLWMYDVKYICVLFFFFKIILSKVNQEVLGRIFHILFLIRHRTHRWRRLQQFFVAARTCIPNRCVAMKGDTLTEWEGFMKYAVEMGSGGMIYVPGFMKIGSIIQKLRGGDTQTRWRSHKPNFIFLKICSYSKSTACNQRVFMVSEIRVNNYHPPRVWYFYRKYLLQTK